MNVLVEPWSISPKPNCMSEPHRQSKWCWSLRSSPDNSQALSCLASETGETRHLLGGLAIDSPGNSEGQPGKEVYALSLLMPSVCP